MTTPTPAARSGADAPRRAWRPVVLWGVFFALLVVGLVLAVRFGPSATALADQVPR